MDSKLISNPTFFLLLLLFAIFSASTSCLAKNLYANIHGTVEGQILTDEFFSFYHDHHISIDGGKIRTHAKASKTFQIDHIPVGIHFMNIFHPEHHFPTYMIKVSKVDVNTEDDSYVENADNLVSVFVYDPLLGITRQLSTPITARPLYKQKLVTHRSSLAFLSFFKSPMIIFGLIFFVLVQFLPYLQKMAEPETEEDTTPSIDANNDSEFISKL